MADQLFSVVATHETGLTIDVHPAYVRTDTEALEAAIDLILAPGATAASGISEIEFNPVARVERGWRFGVEDLATWVAGVQAFAESSDLLSDDPEWAAEHARDDESF